MALALLAWYWLSWHDVDSPGMVLALLAWYWLSWHDIASPGMVLALLAWYELSWHGIGISIKRGRINKRSSQIPLNDVGFFNIHPEKNIF